MLQLTEYIPITDSSNSHKNPKLNTILQGRKGKFREIKWPEYRKATHT